MSIDFKQFKEHVRQRRIGAHQSFGKLIREIESLYSEEDFKFFYVKNMVNSDGKVDAFMFLENGFINFKVIESKIEMKHIYGRPLSKTLTLRKTDGNGAVLVISFDNGEELIFDAAEDSNEDWEQLYSDYIKELYKIL